MANVTLSKGEKAFIKNGIKCGIRQDGRGLEDYRGMEVETGVVPHCYGSARVKMGRTDVMVGVKAEIIEPPAEHPSCGSINFFVDCSAVAAPDFEGQGGSDLAEVVACTMDDLYKQPGTFDLHKLCILDGCKCWNLYADVLLLEIGGNLFDVVSLAIQAAFFSTRLPKVTVITEDSGHNEIDLSDDPSDLCPLPTQHLPCVVTINNVDGRSLVDASLQEEAVVTGRVLVGVVDGGEVVMVRKTGAEGITSDQLRSAVQMASKIGGQMNRKLNEVLNRELNLFASNPSDDRSIDGFIK